jgi:hypothetical protein
MTSADDFRTLAQTFFAHALTAPDEVTDAEMDQEDTGSTGEARWSGTSIAFPRKRFPPIMTLALLSRSCYGDASV